MIKHREKYELRLASEDNMNNKIEKNSGPSKKGQEFNFSLSEMKKAIMSPKSVVPKINTVDDLDKWLECC